MHMFSLLFLYQFNLKNNADLLDVSPYEDNPSKLAKVEVPPTNIVGVMPPGSVGMGFPPQSTFGAIPPIYNSAVAVPPGWPVPRPQPWFPQHPAVPVPPAAPLGLAQRPLFPIQNVTPPLPSATLQPSFQTTPPGPLSSSPTPVSQPLFPVVGTASIPSQNSQVTAAALSAPITSSTPSELNNPSYSSINTSMWPIDWTPPMIANKAPVIQPASNEVYLVWDDEAMSMEERRMSLLKYQVHDETSQASMANWLFPFVAFVVIFYDHAVHSNLTQMNSVDAAIDRRISEGRLAGRMAF
ncbi:Protein suppressor of FRI 4 [Vitis vinifera]|uniref:Protein suppressor of FRI 4 n=1 Tax=Vitis vinifera TaxID=29760 RepID=A0A438J3Y8_VITVI|nr:Protein suppressor of FRI 4 [Vitis vinifera]